MNFKGKLLLKRVFDKAPWTFAKTMPENPHEYTLRKLWDSGEEFEYIVQLIREIGYSEAFRKTRYIYVNINNHKYWTMGSPLSETILINRAKINVDTEYDRIADGYDDLFVSQDFHNEDNEIGKMLATVMIGTVLDIGCGTGHVLEMYGGEDIEYHGIDPSIKMLNRFHVKYPAHKVRQTRFEDYVSGNRYDSIVSTYGSISYVSNPLLVLDYLKPKGTYFLMFYADDYKVFTHQNTGIHPSYKLYNKEMITSMFGLGRVFKWKNYFIATNALL